VGRAKAPIVQRLKAESGTLVEVPPLSELGIDTLPAYAVIRRLAQLDGAVAQLFERLTQPVGEEPEGAAITPDGVHLFIACEASDYVAMLDARTLKTIKTIPLQGRPRGALVSKDGNSLYVSVEGAGGGRSPDRSRKKRSISRGSSLSMNEMTSWNSCMRARGPGASNRTVPLIASPPVASTSR